MTSFQDLIQQGAGNAWLFIPSAILLGALHGLEPGHSKTMMAAFIVAIRGTVAQAVLLGLSATISHTAVVWGVALLGMYFGGQLNAERTEPYFQMASAVLIIGIALWMLWRTYREQQKEKSESDHGHHHHHKDAKPVRTSYGDAKLEIFEDGVPPRFRLRFDKAPDRDASIAVATIRPDGRKHLFTLEIRDDFYESSETIPEPHEFTARVMSGHDDHYHRDEVRFAEHDHGHSQGSMEHGLDVTTTGYQDAHERAHATDIQRRFTDRNITTGQIVVFGLTGGLVPCPASITILLLCLQLKHYILGIALVLCFSIGLAMTMVLSGTIAALSVRQVTKRWNGFGAIARRAPYVSSAIIILVGLYTGYLGWEGLHGVNG